MTIAEIRGRCNAALATVPRDALVLALVVLAALLGFGLGYLSGVNAQEGSMVSVEAPAPSTGSPVVASKNGSKYYFPWCAGAERIHEANKTWFASEAAAQAQGYTLGLGCLAR